MKKKQNLGEEVYNNKKNIEKLSYSMTEVKRSLKKLELVQIERDKKETKNTKNKWWKLIPSLLFKIVGVITMIAFWMNLYVYLNWEVPLSENEYLLESAKFDLFLLETIHQLPSPPSGAEKYPLLYAALFSSTSTQKEFEVEQQYQLVAEINDFDKEIEDMEKKKRSFVRKWWLFFLAQ